MNKVLTTFLVTLILIASPQSLFAAENTKIKLKTDFNTWNIDLEKAGILNSYKKLSWNGIDVKLPNNLDNNLKSDILSKINLVTVEGVDYIKLKDYLEKKISPKINKVKQDVSIDIDKDNKIIFDGFAMAGEEIDFNKTFAAINMAYKQDIEDVRLPIKKIEPVITIKNEDLKNKGITSLISTGETDFRGSPSNRRNNIKVGLNSFNGTLVAPEEETGAGKILGAVNKSTGYLQELVIKGDKTVPEYGGGLCQVSTTVYRSVLFAGLPITQRKNHSYAVSYYDPQGLDASIYPPAVDLKFKNDTAGHILIQTTTVGNKAYSNIYGTPTNRDVNLIGPYYYKYLPIPHPRTEYTTKLKPGEKEILGQAHVGFQSSWYRHIDFMEEEKPEILEHIYSNYTARPLYTLIGIDE